MNVDAVYAGLICKVVTEGEFLKSRNDYTWRLCCPDKITFTSAPLVSVRKTAWKNALREWEWFMSGSNNVNDLHPSVRPWWEPWADMFGFVGMNYSLQFRDFWGREGKPVDQVRALIDGVKDHPHSRRHVITTWNTADMLAEGTPITNCHGTVIQCFVERGKLCLYTYQRSVDVICGLPHNWIQYWAFLLWLARQVDREAGWLKWEGGDVHVYQQHAFLAGKITSVSVDRVPETPALSYGGVGSASFSAADFALNGEYRPVLEDKAEMVV